MFAAQRGVLAIEESGLLRAGDAGLLGAPAYRDSGEEVREALGSAEFVGRWFALAGSTATIFTLLGVSP